VGLFIDSSRGNIYKKLKLSTYITILIFE
jgi:hypothetical protein